MGNFQGMPHAYVGVGLAARGGEEWPSARGSGAWFLTPQGGEEENFSREGARGGPR